MRSPKGPGPSPPRQCPAPGRITSVLLHRQQKAVPTKTAGTGRMPGAREPDRGRMPADRQQGGGPPKTPVQQNTMCIGPGAMASWGGGSRADRARQKRRAGFFPDLACRRHIPPAPHPPRCRPGSARDVRRDRRTLSGRQPVSSAFRASARLFGTENHTGGRGFSSGGARHSAGKMIRGSFDRI